MAYGVSDVDHAIGSNGHSDRIDIFPMTVTFAASEEFSPSQDPGMGRRSPQRERDLRMRYQHLRTWAKKRGATSANPTLWCGG